MKQGSTATVQCEGTKWHEECRRHSRWSLAQGLGTWAPAQKDLDLRPGFALGSLANSLQFNISNNNNIISMGLEGES